MLQIHYGLNQPFSSAHTPAREALNTADVFAVGQIVTLENGKARLALTPADGVGSEFVFEPNNKNWTGTVPTVTGRFEGSTDQIVTTDTFADRALLVSRNGLLSVAASPAEQELAIAMCIGVPSNGILRFKTR